MIGNLFAHNSPERRDVPLSHGATLILIDHWIPSTVSSDALLHITNETPWNHVPVIMAGREVMQPRLTAAYGDAGLTYRYSGTVNTPLPWTPTLDSLRRLVAVETGALPNFVLMNCYRDGNDSIGWHADDERDLVAGSSIACVSLGDTRRFNVKPKVKGKTLGTDLHDGTLCVMGGTMQQHYLHSIAKEAFAGLRVSLTFRTVRL